MNSNQHIFLKCLTLSIVIIVLKQGMCATLYRFSFIFKILCYPQPKTFFSILFRERGRVGEIERETERERCDRETSIGCLLICSLTGNRTLNLGICPDQELNPWPFSLRDKAPTNWATPARDLLLFLIPAYSFPFQGTHWNLFVGTYKPSWGWQSERADVRVLKPHQKTVLWRR